MIKRVIAFSVLFVSAGFALIINSVSRLWRKEFQRESVVGPRSIVVSGTFHNPNWFISHLTPLTKSKLGQLVVVADETHADMDNLVYFCPPPIAQRLLGRAGAKLVWMIYAGFKFKPDLFMGYHIFPNTLNAFIASRLFSRPACYQCCGGPVEMIGGGVNCENRLMRWLQTPSSLLESMFMAIVRDIEHVVVRGESAKAFFSQRHVRGKITIIPGSIKIPETDMTAERPFDIIFVGRLEAIKQPEQVISAIQSVSSNKTDVKAVIVGEGPLGDQLKAQVDRAGLTNNVDFLGKRKDVEALLGQAKTFILTSRSEGLSIAMAEAMASGTVPVVADVGDLKDLVKPGETGYLIEPNNVAAYAKSLLTLLTDTERLSLCSGNARDAAIGYNSVTVIAQKWHNCLTDA